MSKERNWFIEHGYRYDLKNHCWLQDDISNMLENGEKELPKRETAFYEASQGIIGKTSVSRSKPFSKIHNTLIFNNCTFPLKWHEVMFKK